jgi:hypothetical protein
MVKRGEYVFISDKEKGILLALTKVFPIAILVHCCNYICNNLTTNFGNICKPLFWACARAKTKEAYKKALLKL